MIYYDSDLLHRPLQNVCLYDLNDLKRETSSWLNNGSFAETYTLLQNSSLGNISNIAMTKNQTTIWAFQPICKIQNLALL